MSLTTKAQLQACAEAARDYSAGQLSKVTEAVTRTIEELDGVKEDKPYGTSVTIPTDGWGSDSDAEYPNYYDIAVSGLEATDRADVMVIPGSIAAAQSCGMCPVSESVAGAIRIRAVSVPSEEITAQYWITVGLTEEQVAAAEGSV